MTYYCYRRHRREKEIDRIFKALGLDDKDKEAYADKSPRQHFIWSVVYLSVVSIIGFILLFMGTELNLTNLQVVKISKNVSFPAKNSWIICGMGFLGAYVWGVQHIFRRYLVIDLFPAVYYRVSIRMILAAVVALVIYNAYEALPGTDGITESLWPALAFVIGMFPKRGLKWLTERIPLFATETNPTILKAPLELIEGLTVNDKIRLEEVGIDSCYDLAPHDFVPLVLKTPYGARELADWILQAKLCVYFGEAVNDLRQLGIRRITDLEDLKCNGKEYSIQDLARDTSVTAEAITRAQRWLQDNSEEIVRLLHVEKRLGTFTK